MVTSRCAMRHVQLYCMVDGYGRVAHFYQRLKIPPGIRRRGREEEEEEEEYLKKERERPLGWRWRLSVWLKR